MGKRSMTCSMKSICATPTDAPAIIKSSDVGYSEMAAALDGALTIAANVIFFQIERATSWY